MTPAPALSKLNTPVWQCHTSPQTLLQVELQARPAGLAQLGRDSCNLATSYKPTSPCNKFLCNLDLLQRFCINFKTLRWYTMFQRGRAYNVFSLPSWNTLHPIPVGKSRSKEEKPASGEAQPTSGMANSTSGAAKATSRVAKPTSKAR